MTSAYVVDGPSALPAAVGRRLGPSPWIVVTQDMIDRFADLTHDRQWIHVDPARAERETLNGRTIAHGYLTLSLLPALQAGLIRFEGFDRILNYGLDRLRYPSAVETGRRMRLRQTVEGVTPIDEATFRLTLASTIEVEDQERPALVATLIAQLHGRPAAPG